MKKSYVYAAIAIFFWSTLSTISKLLLGSFSGTQVLCVSALFSFLALLVWNVATGEIKKLKAFTSPGAFGVAEALDKVDRIVGGIFIIDGVFGFELGRCIFLFCYSGHLLS